MSIQPRMVKNPDRTLPDAGDLPAPFTMHGLIRDVCTEVGMAKKSRKKKARKKSAANHGKRPNS